MLSAGVLGVTVPHRGHAQGIVFHAGSVRQRGTRGATRSIIGAPISVLQQQRLPPRDLGAEPADFGPDARMARIKAIAVGGIAHERLLLPLQLRHVHGRAPTVSRRASPVSSSTGAFASDTPSNFSRWAAASASFAMSAPS